ncbi:MAG: carboxypeptidase regulatory-like domain-containing protein, partial [candidate division KSB1 bacterium]|nr:carboxypeptidase regulatory-like domain-containing protein [candidate division KSB1 bacterium]
ATVFCWSVNQEGVAVQTSISNNQGEYSLRHLDAGDYYVVATAENYDIQFYRNGRSPMDADPVHVDDGAAVTGIDFNLKKLAGGAGAISGRVTDEATGTPIAGAWIVALSRKSPFAQKNLFAVSDASGNYKISNVPDDTYLVAAYANGYLPEYYENAYAMVKAKPVIVKGQEVPNIDFPLAKGGTISGKVTAGEGKPVAGAIIAAQPFDNRPALLDIPGVNIVRQTAVTDEEGKYIISGLPEGTYRVMAQATIGSFNAVLFFDNKKNAKDADPVAVQAGKETAGVDFNFAEPTAKITGTVRDSSGAPIKGAFVTFVFKNQTEELTWAKLRRYAETDSEGKYELANLRPGVYFVGAWIKDARQLKGVWYDGAASLKEATPIQLAEGQIVAGIDFVLDTSTDYGALSGKVTFEGDDSPVVNAVIQAIPKRGNVKNSLKHFSQFFTTTDETGAYRLYPLCEGDYYIAVRLGGYVEYFDNKPAQTADVVHVTAGQETANINFQIPAPPASGSVIAGTVIDEATGAPLPQALVTVFPAKRPQNASEPAAQWTRTYYAGVTDADGTFEIGGIAAGRYIVSAWARGYVGEFYDNTHNPTAAVVLEMDGTNRRDGIEIALQPAQVPQTPLGGVLAGEVNDGNEGVDQAMVCAVDENNRVVQSCLTAPDGSFALTGLDSGSYRLMVARPAFQVSYYPSADPARSLAVDSADPNSTIDLALTLSVDPASITAPAGKPILSYRLEQNYPNPFNPSTTLIYHLPRKAAVTLSIFNVHGQWVTTLVDGVQDSGIYQVVWNGLDQKGKPVPSGVYICRFEADEFTDFKSMLLLK